MRSPRLLSFSLLALSSLSFAQFSGSTPPPASLKAGFDSINPKDGLTFLRFLSGPQTQGRGTGQPGFQKAADFMAAHFKEFGLKPVGDNGTYFQGVPFWRSHFVDAGSYIKSNRSGKSIAAGPMFRMSSISRTMDSSTVIVELGGTDKLPEFDEASIQGRIVVLPEFKNMRMVGPLLRARPAAILMVAKDVPPSDYSIRRSAPTADAPIRPAMGSITPAAYAQLSKDLSWSETKPNMRVSQGMVRMVAKVESEDLKVPNVVGLLEGSDPTMKAEIVGIGAHLDHLGINGGVVFPGADDDGSGSTALLQVIKAFSVNPVKPKRSILFMAFCGEEMGLIGSGWYSDHPIFPHEQMVTELQMDMVGRRSSGAQNGDQNRIDKEDENIDTIRLVGSKRISTDLDKTIMEADKSVNFRFKYDAEDVYTRSDHYNFAKHGIPIAFFFTGFHPDYHQPTDTIDKIDFTKIANTAKLVYLTANMIADNPERPKHDVVEK
jgi:hypothetical protein